MTATPFEPTALPGVFIVTPPRHGDARGFFSETYKRSDWEAAGIACDFVQDNHSRSGPVGTLRGLHFQRPPLAQAKLVRVVRGSVLDVVVDIRRSSPTFGRHIAVELSERNWRQLFVPAGFAHGFVTREPDAEVLYKVSTRYAPECEGGVAFDDPDLAIDWGIGAGQATMAARDRAWPRLRDLPDVFP